MIETGDHPPISQQPYRPPDRLLSGIMEELDTLAVVGIINPSTSAWSRQMIPVRKPNGKVRICILITESSCNHSQTSVLYPDSGRNS